MQRHTTMHAAYGTSLRDCEERNLSVESMTSREIKFYAYFLYSNRSGDGDSCICNVVSSNITNYMYSKAPTFWHWHSLIVKSSLLRLCFTGRPALSAAMPVLFLLSSPKIGSPEGATRCPGKREMRSGRSAPPCQISRLSGQKCGNTAPKTIKLSNFDHKFAPQRSLVCTVVTKLSDIIHVYR